jgi:hypothetical protein
MLQDSENMMPPIKAYSKTEICYLLVDPRANLAAPTGRRLPTQKLKKMIIAENMLVELGIDSEIAYDNIRYFSPMQSELILRRLL